jgi:predicted alpha/beta hydrolase
MSSILLNTTDGTRVSARLFLPTHAPKGAVLIAAAMGVKQAYYADFAAWLARQGYAALTFDYRGMGDSRPAALRHSLRGFEADLFDWADDVISPASRPMRRCTSWATAWARSCPACSNTATASPVWCRLPRAAATGATTHRR